jgi:amino acid transporter
VINLRGVKESGTAFAIPTYYFLLMMALIIIIGFVRFFTGNLASVPNPPELQTITNTLQPITLFLILKAFASGTTALTGVEAISNGITAFKEPRSKNAAQTLIWMAAILGSTMFGITFLAHQIGALPSEQETVISQLARTALGDRGLLYLAVITSTTVILMMAANTAFADFPRLSALQANDGFLPRQLTARGSRLVFSRGIVALALVSSLLIFVFQASVNRLIPLYAIGVFLSFTLSQTGMARRWWKSGHLAPDEELKEQGSTVHYEKHWMLKMIINGFGAVCTFIVMLVFATTKFTDGAYVVVILLPILVSIFFFIHRHYKNLARQLSLEKGCPERRITRHRIIMPIGGVHKGTLTALRFARTLSTDITAVYVAVNPEEKEKIQSKCEQWGDGIRLVILESPYRVFMEPLVAYIENLEKICKKGEVIDIIVPHFVPRHWWVNFLHTRTADTLRQALLHRDNVIITEIPYQVD